MAKAFVLVTTHIGSEEEVLNALSRVEEVKEAYIVYGIYDILVKVEAEDMESLREAVTSKIRRIPKVRSTMTMIVVEEKRFER